MTATIRTEVVAVCPLCGSRGAKPICKSRDRQHGLSEQRFIYSRCRSCGVVFQSLRPVESGIATFYPDDYVPYQSAPPAARLDGPHSLRGPHRPAVWKRWPLAAAERINRYLRRRFPDPLPAILDAVYAPPRPGAVMLDFGCGSADALDRARNRGWRTIGADFIEPVVAAVKSAGHDAYLCSDAMWDSIPDASLDLVRMNHVIEHLYRPRETLRNLRQKLRPGGRLHLATPNSESLSFRLLRERWYPLECPRHIVIYTPRAARRLLLEVGFTKADCYQEVLTKDTARSIGYWMLDWGRVDTAGALGMMHRPQLAELLFAPARIAALRGTADRFHAIATA
jgi:SAM-dependent methyltransferase